VMRRSLSVAIVVGSAFATPLAAQESNFALAGSGTAARSSGWTFTPALVYQSGWDDNVLLRGNGDEAPADYINLLNPRASVNFVGRRSEFAASYDGNFVFYRDLNQLNSYDQRGTVSARRLIARHTTVWVQNSAVTVP